MAFKAFTIYSSSLLLPFIPIQQYKTALGICFALFCLCIFAGDVLTSITFLPWIFHSEKPSLKAQLKCHTYKRLFLTSNIPERLVFPFSVIPLFQHSDHKIIVCPYLPYFTMIQLNRDMLFSFVFTRPSGLVQHTFTNPSFVLHVISCT